MAINLHFFLNYHLTKKKKKEEKQEKKKNKLLYLQKLEHHLRKCRVNYTDISRKSIENSTFKFKISMKNFLFLF
jgi:hypothetical protein